MELPRFSFAFQPIVHASSGQVWSHEALIRGVGGEPAWQVLSGLDESRLHRLDAVGRGKAIDLALQLGLTSRLNLNFLPRSLVEEEDMLEAMFLAAQRHDLPLERLVLEVTESEAIGDLAGFAQRMRRIRALGLQLAIDDFGAGHCGLNLLAEFQPDLLKLDMALLRGIERSGPRQAIVRAVLGACLDLGIEAVAEGVETLEEYRWLAGEGVELFQGYLFGRPSFEALPAPRLPHMPA
ncbi:EAL domain-containing protein [Sphaerotilus natans]|uniref:EAL domain-containing protein n=1 Tax=Sphaerotilus natans TaxID=34103 RepID=UPI00406CF09F